MSSKTYIGSVAQTSTPGVITGQSIGSAASDRKVVFVCGGSVNYGVTNLSATIDGVAMDADLIVISPTDGNGGGVCLGVFSKDWPTGTTADFVITATGNSLFASVSHFYAINGCDPVADSASDNGADSGGTGNKSLTLDADTTVDAIVIGAVHAYNVTGAASFSGLTADANNNIYGSHLCAVASLSATTVETPRAISATQGLVDSTGRVWVGAAVVYPAVVVPEITAEETDAAFALAPSKIIAAGMASETDTAQALLRTNYIDDQTQIDIAAYGAKSFYSDGEGRLFTL